MKKTRLLLLGICFVSINICSAQRHTTHYIDKFLPMAKGLSAKWGIPVSVILGVSILESGSGTSLNCKQLNNYFGVKGWNIFHLRHTKYKQYSSAESSFNDFCKIVARKNFYDSLKGNPDYNLWLNAMNRSKYSTAQGIWLQRIKKIIRHHELHRYDVEVLGLPAIAKHHHHKTR